MTAAMGRDGFKDVKIPLEDTMKCLPGVKMSPA